MRSGTVPVPLCVGMATAAKLLHGVAAERERASVRSLRDRFAEGLSRAGIAFAVNGPPNERRHPGNLSICFPGYDAHDILGALQPHVAASTGSTCTAGTPEPSHVLKAIGLTDAQADSTIRFSLGRFTSGADIDEAVSHVASALAGLSGHAQNRGRRTESA